MDIVFISNYYNHHQAPFSDALIKKEGINYHFIETGIMPDERKKLGYGMLDCPSYVIRYEEFVSNRFKIQMMVDDADVVIIGSAPDELLNNRRLKNRPIFRYSERLYKRLSWKLPAQYIKNHFRYGKYGYEYVLCSSAFTAYDFARTDNFIGRTYKWGYFPKTFNYDVKHLLKEKIGNSILWSGRLIDWKHPEISIIIAEKLKKEGFDFQLNIIGTGILFDSLQRMIKEKQLDDCVFLLGSMSPSKVRSYMEKSDIFLATSDRNEGWGAVVNEAMNSGCAVVANSETGSVPFLINHRSNGIIYANGDIYSAYSSVKFLLSHNSERNQLGANAYRTIINMWNAEVAADRFVELANEIMNIGRCDLFNEGPCSRAEVLKDDWFKG